jgi:UDP:flavonoid glycosyltransferase YjiC (YdhE family)
MEVSDMRTVFTCLAATGHFHPLVPIARAMANAGHDVAFATHDSIAPLVERAGFRQLKAGRGFMSPEIAPLMAEMIALDPSEHKAFAARRIFAEALAPSMAGDLLSLLERWPADLLVHDITELGGCVVAERLGVPHAAISVLATGLPPETRGWVAGPVGALRAAHGLPPDSELTMLDTHLTLQPFPEAFMDPSRPRLGRPPHFIRPTPFDRSGDEDVPAWLGALPARPTVYATLGTAFNSRVDLFAAFLAGLREEPLNLIVTVGRDQDPAQFGPQPPHVRIERYIPQTLVLSRCDLVLTHGGSGTVMAALTHGLPLVLIPISADQPENADRCATLGVGRVVGPADVTPEAVRGAVRAVLTDPAYRRNAERLRAEIDAMPRPEHAVRLLEQLASSYGLRRPLDAGSSRRD